MKPEAEGDKIMTCIANIVTLLIFKACVFRIVIDVLNEEKLSEKWELTFDFILILD